jgi:transcriptional antiterminator NusG
MSEQAMSDQETPEMTETTTDPITADPTDDPTDDPVLDDAVTAPIETDETVAEPVGAADDEVDADDEVAETDEVVAEPTDGDAAVADEVVADPDVSFDLTDTAGTVDGDAVESDEVADEDVAAVEVDDPWTRPGSWYVVHTQSGYEKKVTANLHARIQSMNMEDKIFEVVIPMEEVVEFKNGRRQTVQRKVFPGYLLVRCVMDDESWYCVRNTPGVRVREGPFADFSGEIAEINADHLKLKVLVNIFGRETLVEMDFSQVAKL